MQLTIVTVFSTIQPPYSEIQISCKGEPDQIWNIQPGGPFGDGQKSKDHNKNQNPQQNQPEKREQIPAEIKEKGGPEEIDGQLQEIDSKCTGDCVFISTGYENQIRRDSHQKVQDGPYHWKQPGRRRQWRLIERPEGIHFIAGQKRCGQTCK